MAARTTARWAASSRRTPKTRRPRAEAGASRFGYRESTRAASAALFRALATGHTARVPRPARTRSGRSGSRTGPGRRRGVQDLDGACSRQCEISLDRIDHVIIRSTPLMRNRTGVRRVCLLGAIEPRPRSAASTASTGGIRCGSVARSKPSRGSPSCPWAGRKKTATDRLGWGDPPVGSPPQRRPARTNPGPAQTEGPCQRTPQNAD